MSEQGARGEGRDEKHGERGGERGDWWAQLYDATASDTGRTRAPDTLDDRFASVTHTLAPRGGNGDAPREEPAMDGPAPVEPARGEPAEGEPARGEPVPECLDPALPEPPQAPQDLEDPEEDGVIPLADPAGLSELVAEVALDGGRHGGLTLRAASLRGAGAKRAGTLRGDALLTARFGTGEGALLLVAVAVGAHGGPGAHRAAREACHSIGSAVGRSHARLAEDIRAGRRGALKSGLHRLTDRTFGKLRAQAAALGLEPEQYTADLCCLLLPADPRCQTRIFFGIGAGGLFRLRDGRWHDIEPQASQGESGGPVVGFGAGPAPVAGPGPEPATNLAPTPPEDPRAQAAAARDGFTAEPPAPARAESFRFRASVARPGDALMVCSPGFAVPLREERSFAGSLAARWMARSHPPGLAAYLADIRTPLKGHDLDRTAVTVWEAAGHGNAGAERSAPDRSALLPHRRTEKAGDA
ncbi:protein phosphatase 2C domain-containing protein [Streptomyces sp. NBC_01795]|uniref:protein phosphatase 2C domain-containing protein n=1 Tax=Streptomyces sp. NBC_01795 TaxID=2975943 RepID=UPI002DD7EF50|nr:protein phosphatase 2C domain-containing protein [Streptomyces sp. NBC_01795]WSA91625.1 protein phosphatase 2C domain-containing protein [Streptomyces sp. NBC_01795]